MTDSYKANWFSVLRKASAFVTEFNVGVNSFLLTKITESHYKIENITVPTTPVTVYEIDKGEIITYDTAGDWETCFLVFGKAVADNIENAQYWTNTIGVIPSDEDANY